MSRAKTPTTLSIFAAFVEVESCNREDALNAAKGQSCDYMSDYGNLMTESICHSKADVEEWMVDNNYTGIVFKMVPVSENIPKSTNDNFNDISAC